MKRVFSKIAHLCMVVDNCTESVKCFSDVYGIGPWRAFKFDGQVYDHHLYGEEKHYNAKVALCDMYPLQLELVEALDDISQYYEYIKKHGPFVHHLGVRTESSYEETEAFLDGRGCKDIMNGTFPKHATFHYFDTAKDLVIMTEVVHRFPDAPNTPTIIFDEFYPNDNEPNKVTPVFSKIVSIGFVVYDCMETVKIYEDNYGVGPWTISSGDDVAQICCASGEHFQLNAKVATCDMYPLRIKIIEPLDDQSQFASFLKEHGPCVHHIGVETAGSFEEVAAFLNSKGCAELMSVTFSAGSTVHYFDTLKDLGFIVEIVDTT